VDGPFHLLAVSGRLYQEGLSPILHLLYLRPL